jgi:hypothetical protein
MINYEGVKEIIDVFDALKIEGKELNFEKGILQSIGYKEYTDFYNYLADNPELKQKCLSDKTFYRKDTKISELLK